ncbi:MAG: hypothetical protein ACO3X1_16145, partial [Burkholderiaceae bacterium]
MSRRKTRREALKVGFGVFVGLPAVTALNACTQCSKPTGTSSEPASTPAGAADSVVGSDLGEASTPTAAGGESLTLL